MINELLKLFLIVVVTKSAALITNKLWHSQIKIIVTIDGPKMLVIIVIVGGILYNFL